MELNKLKSLITKIPLCFQKARRANGVFMPEGLDRQELERIEMRNKLFESIRKIGGVSVRKEMTGDEILKLWKKK